MLLQRLMMMVMLVCGGFIAGMQYFAHMIRIDAALSPASINATMEKTGIAVLTGSGGRIEAGMTLLLSDQGQRMLISGIGDGVSKDDILRIAGVRATFSSDLLEEKMACCIDLGSVARNTRGNARETSRWVDQNRLDTVILVTADFHIPRALVEFRREMPEQRVIPHAVPTKGLGLDSNGTTQWWQSGKRLLTVSREFGKYLASLIS